MGVSKELEEQFNMLPYEEFVERHPESLYWKTFLIQTDYVANKIVEASYLGESLDEDYTEILEARKLCRQRLNALAKESEV